MFKTDYFQALNDYKRLRRKEALRALLSRMTGLTDDSDLLSYDEVRNQLQAIEKSTRRLEDIPLDAIVGSVGRYHDFSRKYLPKANIDKSRWARVKASTLGLAGLPPIEVYQIGEVYFVKDGNHRVSVAREMDNPTIQAHITEVKTKVALTPDVTPDDIIIKAEQVKFLEITKLDKLRSGADLSATTAGAYPTLLEHIEVHRYFMGLEGKREIPYLESVAHWYDEVFIPTVNIIRNRNLLNDFPDRTVADLYLWAAEHRAELEEDLGWDIGPEAALTDLAAEHGQKTLPILLKKWAGRISNLLPTQLESGPPPGTWRERLEKMTILEHIFNDIIVALDDSPNAWHALNLAIEIGEHENSRIHGMHVHPPGSEPHDHHPSEERFNQYCQDARIREFNYQFQSGEIGSLLCESARYTDLIVLPLNHPPGQSPIKRLSSGLTTIIRGCPSPILTVPGPNRGIRSILIAFDSSLKALEALFIAAYFGTQFSSNLHVLSSEYGYPEAQESIDQAQAYLSKFPLSAQYHLSENAIPEAIKEIQSQKELDMILMGGYGGSVLQDLVAGSVVDQVLREINLPILICR